MRRIMRFDGGWDKMREPTLVRQIEMGIVSKGTKLAGKPKDIKDALSADEKKLFTRQMEVYGGFAEYCDYEIGRLFDALGYVGQFDNTLSFTSSATTGRAPRVACSGCSTR